MGTIEEVTVTIPMVPGPGLSPNARVHWGTRKKQVAELREAAYYATLGLNGGQREWLFMGYAPRNITPRLRMDCHIAWPKGRKRHDDDNAWTMIKSARDGVASAAHISDAVFATGDMTQSRGDGTITLTFRRHEQKT